MARAALSPIRPSAKAVVVRGKCLVRCHASSMKLAADVAETRLAMATSATMPRYCAGPDKKPCSSSKATRASTYIAVSRTCSA